MRSILYASLLYIVALHGVVAVLVFKTNFLLLAGKTLGWVPPEEWSVSLLLRALETGAQDRGVPPGSIILVGDSLIRQVDAQLVARNAINFGIGGDTTRTLKARLPILRSTEQAGIVVLAVGVNDLKYRNVSDVLRDYADLLKLLPSDSPLILMSVLPVNERNRLVARRTYLRNAVIGSLNVGIRQLCESREHCDFLDANAMLSNPENGSLNPAFDGGDGWHLSAQGSRHLANLIKMAALRKQGSQSPSQ